MERQGAHESVIGDEFTLLGEQVKYRGHVLVLTGERDGLCMLPLLMLGELLLEQVCERVAEAVLLKVGPGDAGRILLRGQVIDLLQLRTILAPGHRGWIADRRSLGGKGADRQGQHQRRGAKAECSFHG